MARIRSIKPEFWQDHRIAAELSRDQRLFYVGLWNDADDEGRFQAHPRRLLGVVFPYDRDLSAGFIEDSLRTLADTGRVVLYTVNGEPYGQLTKFAGHQRINRPSPSRIPAPDSELAHITERSVNAHVAVSEGSEHGARTRDLGSRSRDLGARSKDQGEQRARSLTQPPPSWSQSACDIWAKHMEGKPPGGKIGHDLKPLVTEHGVADVLQVWELYLAGHVREGRAQFANSSDFASKYGLYREHGGLPPPSRSGRKSTRDATAELLRHREELEQVPLNTGSIFDHDR